MDSKNIDSKIKVLDIVKRFGENSKADYQRSMMIYINFLLASSAWYRSRERLRDYLVTCISEVLDLIDFDNQGTPEKLDL